MRTAHSTFKLLPGVTLTLALALAPGARADSPTGPVSFSTDVVPLLKRSCTGCHFPGKLKGELDLTTYASISKGGKHGPAVRAGNAKDSRLLEEISGEEPSMPKEGDPLTKAEVNLIERWIVEGAKDDTPAEAPAFTAAQPPVYSVPPVISALAFSPDGAMIAVSGYHEVLLHKSDGSALEARLIGASPRIESLAFSQDGKKLALSGGAPARFGEIQIWDTSTSSQLRAYRISADSLYGISISPDAERVAFGCADKTVRMIRVADGQEVLKFDNHSDWVLATTFSSDGKRLLTGSRDRAMKLIDAANGQFIDDINKLLEGVLCLARHPKLDQVIYGGDLGGLRLYRMAENQERTAANRDVNMLREFERQPGAVRAVAYSPRGDLVAAGGAGPEVPLYKTSDGTRAATLTGHQGAVFSLAFHPKKEQIAVGGYDGTIRLYDTASGHLLHSFSPVPLKAPTQVAAQGSGS